MLKHHLTSFFRNLQRQKLFSFINLLGLTVSMVSTVLIYLYVRHEFSYDSFHPHAKRIYRVNQTFIWGESDQHQFASTGPGVAHALLEELDEIELITSIHTPGNFLITYTNDANQTVAIEQQNILAADSNFFNMFNFPLIKGDKETALKEAQSLVLTNSAAKKYFGDEDPLGKLVFVGNEGNRQTFEVTGVLADVPDNSYIQFDVLLSMESFPAVRRLHWSWVWTQLETYVRLNPHTDIEHTRAKLTHIPRKHAEQTLQRAMNVSFDEYIASGKNWELFLQPLTRIHLPSEIVYNRLNDSGNIKIVYSLIFAAIFIVLLSSVNFMNLSTAQFMRKIKEASMRKIMGLSRASLSFNYFFEAFTFCSMAMLMALGLVQILLPGFNQLTGQSLAFDVMHDLQLMMALLLLVLMMSLLAGIYPAFFLTSFNPAEALKGKIKTGRSGKTFRNGLVVFQFSVSLILITCTAIVSQQLHFFAEKDLGFEKENLLVIENVERVPNGENWANSAATLPGVLSASWCTSVPPKVWGGDTFSAEGLNAKTIPINYTLADENFIPTLALRLRHGRNFSSDIPGDVNRVILNEVAVERIGWPADESVIGKKLFYGDAVFEVAGIVSDFNYWSLATPIEPFAIFHIKTTNLQDWDRQFLSVRLSAENFSGFKTAISELSELWKQHAGDYPFEYSFVDQAFAATFKNQEQFRKALVVLAGLAITIACLGLLGMIVYSLEQRTKEIGIRKVSGASALDILTLISKGYSRLILLAFVLSAPLTYWMMQQWLKDFAYRVEISPYTFVFSGLGALLLAMLITSYHATKASLLNPVDVLKDE